MLPSPATTLPTGFDVRPLVETWLGHALREQASDLHVEPTAGGCELRLRIDGVLQTAETLEASVGRAFVNRLM